MERLSRTETITKIVEHRVQLNSGNVVVVKDFYDEKDSIIDTTVLTKDGYEIDDDAEVQEVLDFLDELGNWSILIRWNKAGKLPAFFG